MKLAFGISYHFDAVYLPTDILRDYVLLFDGLLGTTHWEILITVTKLFLPHECEITFLHREISMMQ